MTLLNTAEKVYVGASEVERAYLGSTLVYEAFTPPKLPGLDLWYDASQLALANGAAVNSWPNLAAGGQALNLVGTPAPTFATNVRNGLPVVRFVPGGGLKQAAQTRTDREHTFAGVMRMYGATKYRLVVGEFPTVNFLVGYWGGMEDVAFMNAWFSNSPGGAGGPAVTTNWKLYSSDGGSSDAYSAAVAADFPRLHYKMNEPAGVTVATDYSIYGKHGTINGAPARGPAGLAGPCWKFDGVDDQIVFPASFSIANGSSITVEWWQYMATADVANNSTFSLSPSVDGNNLTHSHAPWSDKRLYWDYGNINTTGRISVDYTPRINLWTHICLTYNAASSLREVYFNGVLAGNAVSAGSPTNLTGGFFGAGGYKGYAQHFAVYSVALSPARILAHYNAGAPPSPRLFSNGALLGSSTDPAAMGWTNTFAINIHAGEMSHGEVAEAVMYNRRLSDADRQKLEGYLRRKWAIT